MPIYHRVESPTQTPEVAAWQEASSEIWGRAPQHGLIPAVKGYDGPLPPGARGVEFECDVPPDPGCAPGRPVWRGPRRGVVRRGDFAILSVRVVRNTQVEHPR